MNSKQKGNITELKCILSFIERGYNVSIPYGEDCKYDFIVDIKGKLLRFQSKTSRVTKRKDSIKFSNKMIRKNNHELRKETYSLDDIDYFCTYYNDTCYIIGLNETKTLRFNPTKNNQKDKIHFGEDYTIDKFLSRF